MVEANSEASALLYAGERSSDLLSVVMVGRGFLEARGKKWCYQLFFSDHVFSCERTFIGEWNNREDRVNAVRIN